MTELAKVGQMPVEGRVHTRTARSWRVRVQRLLVSTFFHSLMIGLAFVFLLPLLWMLSASLKTEAELMTLPPTILPEVPQWQNYLYLIQTRIIMTMFFNSVSLAIYNVVGLLFVTSLAAYSFARVRFIGKDLAFSILLSTAMIPGIVYLIPQYIIFRDLGWLDTHLPLWVPRVLTPVYATFLMRQFFKTMPQELEDAAKIDGCSLFGIYWRIMLPQVKPALAAVGVFTFLESWNDLFGPLIFITSIDLQTLPVGLALFQGEYFTQVTLLMAASTVSIIPVLLVYISAQKYFVQGITLTG
ncbi:MAG: carbohydrate ABC transporter permease, partial [Caldilineaceae bacterium]|nr:carbohydrate ABC transporter permease [Caldilineaceae bacterium]